jgi:hypothetical protein
MNLRAVYRITVFIPPDHVTTLPAALHSTGLRRNGNYSDVLWLWSVGEELFTPLAGSTPTLGTAGAATASPSVEAIFSIERDEARLRTVIDAIRSAYPWEEPVTYVDESLALISRD